MSCSPQGWKQWDCRATDANQSGQRRSPDSRPKYYFTVKLRTTVIPRFTRVLPSTEIVDTVRIEAKPAFLRMLCTFPYKVDSLEKIVLAAKTALSLRRVSLVRITSQWICKQFRIRICGQYMGLYEMSMVRENGHNSYLSELSQNKLRDVGNA